MYEIYALRLDHYIDDQGDRHSLDEPLVVNIDDQGDRHSLDEPLVVKMVYDRRYAPLSICINSMIDKMRDEMLKRVGGEE